MSVRSASTLALLFALALAQCSCGSAGSGRETAVTQASDPPTHARGGELSYRTDRDNDNDHNDDDQHVLQFGNPAGAVERAAILSSLERYYAAAAAGDGRAGCALLAPFVAESVAEQYGAISSLRGSNCPEVMSKLFAKHHPELAAKRTSLEIVRIGVEGDHALVAVGFPEIPEVRQMTMRHSNGGWYVLTLLDGIIE